METDRRNQLAIFSEDELRRGLELGGTPESARAVAARVAAIPASEQPYFDWVDSAVLYVSCVSPELARRVAAFFGTTPALRARIEERQREFREWLAARTSQPAAILSLDDVVFDTRGESPTQSREGNGSPRHRHGPPPRPSPVPPPRLRGSA